MQDGRTTISKFLIDTLDRQPSPANCAETAGLSALLIDVAAAINLFADGVRDAFDPRARTWKPRRLAAELRRKVLAPLPLRARAGVTS